MHAQRHTPCVSGSSPAATLKPHAWVSADGKGWKHGDFAVGSCTHSASCQKWGEEVGTPKHSPAASPPLGGSKPWGAVGLGAAVARRLPFLQAVIWGNTRHKHDARELKHWRTHLKIKQAFTLITISVTHSDCKHDSQLGEKIALMGHVLTYSGIFFMEDEKKGQGL